MSAIGRLLPENPVLLKEMRVRMRGARAYWILLGYLGFLSAVLLFTYQGWLHDVAMAGSGGSDSSETGKNIYGILVVCQVFLVLFITPAITSGSITLEKEQQTLDMLTMTRLSRGSMIAGKLMSAVSFTALLLLSSLPLVSICFMLGGVDPAMVFGAYLAMLTGSFLVGAAGLAWSALARTTTVAVLCTYLWVLMFAIVAAVGMGTYAGAYGNPAGATPGGITGFATLAVAETWIRPGLFGLHNVEFVGFALFSLLAGTLLAAFAMVRLETWPGRRAGLLRSLTALLVLFQSAACFVWWLGRVYGSPGLPNVPAVGALAVPLVMLMLLVPVFATGELAASEARQFGTALARGWTPRGLARGRLASGPPFLLLMAVLCLAAYALAFVGFGRPGDLMRSAALPRSAPIAPGQPGGAAAPGTPAMGGGPGFVYRNGALYSVNGKRVAPPTAGPVRGAASGGNSFWNASGDFAQAALLVVAFVFGFAMLCQFLSVASGSRWVAGVAGYAVLFAILALPWLSGSGTDGSAPWPLLDLAYLNPFFSLAAMTDTVASTFSSPALAPLVLIPLPVWLAATLLWTGIGIASLLASVPIARRRAITCRPNPYEDMAVSL